MKKVLFIDQTHPIIRDKLEQAGFNCDLLPGISYDEVSAIIGQYDGIIVRSGILLDEAILTKATKLKFIGRLGSGLESIDVEFAKKTGISCFNSPEGNRDAVGEHTLGLMLALTHKIVHSSYQIMNGQWLREENRGFEIKDKTIGIIGYGQMGSAFAKKASCLQANVISYDKYKTRYANHFTKEVSLQTVFEEADIVSIHIPLTPENRYFVDAAFISSFRKNIYLINTARGPVVKTTDLIDALNSGKILGAALDVIEYEESSFNKMNLSNTPKEFQFLIHHPNVIITPHIAGVTHESKLRLAEVLADKIIEFSGA